MTEPRIKITNWSKLQHFKDRDPVWIKLYLTLRQNRRWRQLSGDGAKLYIDLILLAADDHPLGTITLLPEDLAWEVRLTLPDLLTLLNEVSKSGLIQALGYHADIKLISSGNQDDDSVISLARSREVEKEKEKEKETTSDHPKKKFKIDIAEWRLFEKNFGLDLMSEKEIAEL